jgi:hypothetical protein
MEEKKFQIRGLGFRSEEALLDDWQGLVSPGTCNVRIGRDRAPTQALQTTSLRLLLDGVARGLCLTRRQKNHSEPEHRRQLDACLARLLANQFVRDAGEQTSPVTASSISVHTSAMRQPDQGFERTIYDLPRGGSAHLGDQADTAGVVVCG